MRHVRLTELQIKGADKKKQEYWWLIMIMGKMEIVTEWCISAKEKVGIKVVTFFKHLIDIYLLKTALNELSSEKLSLFWPDYQANSW